MRKQISATIWGLDVEATVSYGDWEGDPSVVNGIHYLPPDIKNLKVLTTDETDITDRLTEDALDDITDELLEAQT